MLLKPLHIGPGPPAVLGRCGTAGGLAPRAPGDVHLAPLPTARWRSIAVGLLTGLGDLLSSPPWAASVHGGASADDTGRAAAIPGWRGPPHERSACMHRQRQRRGPARGGRWRLGVGLALGGWLLVVAAAGA